MNAAPAYTTEMFIGFVYWLIFFAVTLAAGCVSVLTAAASVHGDYTERSSLERTTWTISAAAVLVLFVMVTGP